MKQVLIVDDEQELAELVAEVLEADDCEITRCANGKEAYEACLKKAFDVIVSDVKMPIMDGVEFVKKIREESLNQETKVILVTAYAEEESLAEVRKHNVEILEKPFDMDVIFEKVVGE